MVFPAPGGAWETQRAQRQPGFHKTVPGFSQNSPLSNQEGCEIKEDHRHELHTWSNDRSFTLGLPEQLPNSVSKTQSHNQFNPEYPCTCLGDRRRRQSMTGNMGHSVLIVVFKRPRRVSMQHSHQAVLRISPHVWGRMSEHSELAAPATPDLDATQIMEKTLCMLCMQFPPTHLQHQPAAPVQRHQHL